MDVHVEQLVDLTDPEANHIFNRTVKEARACLHTGDPNAVRRIHGSFALVAREGKTVRIAR